MKKRKFRILSLVLIMVFLLQIAGFSQENTSMEIIHDLGDYKIVAEKYAVAAPRGPVYSYRNYGVVDKAGQVVVEQKYNEILTPSEGRAAFTTNEGDVGFFDENWDVVIEAKYKNNHYPAKLYFSEGLVAVGKRDPEKYIIWGYIDRDGKEVTDFIYDWAEPFENGVAVVQMGEQAYYQTRIKYGKIDKAGNVVQPFKFGYAVGNINEYDYEYWSNEPIDIVLTENLVELNGKLYKNTDIEYPFINYMGYSYIPLTFYGCRKLGVNCDWAMETGLVLTSGGQASEDIMGLNNMKEGIGYKASWYKDKITINGKVYEYGDTAYPLIHFRNIVYMPVLWQEGMEALGIKYDYIGPEKLENSDRGIMVFKTN